MAFLAQGTRQRVELLDGGGKHRPALGDPPLTKGAPGFTGERILPPLRADPDPGRKWLRHNLSIAHIDVISGSQRAAVLAHFGTQQLSLVFLKIDAIGQDRG
ncbi:hypothetical protein D3C73_1204570 [compost metagenome]